MFVQFSDANSTAIISVFASAQNAADWPNQGTVTTSDPRWAAYYATLPAAIQARLPAPTTAS